VAYLRIAALYKNLVHTYIHIARLVNLRLHIYMLVVYILPTAEIQARAAGAHGYISGAVGPVG